MKKAVQVKQRDLTDCGAACLVSVAAYFGLHIPVTRVRLYAGTDKQGTSLQGLMNAAERLRFRVRGAKGGGIPLSGIPVPTIFHQVLENGLQHFVVVYKITKKRVRFMDPMTGKLIYRPITDFKKNWSGVILLLMPSDQFEEGVEKKSVYLRFWQLVKPHRAMLLQAFAGAIVYTILGLSTSIYVQKILDFVLPDSNRQLLNLLSVLMILLLCFQVITGYFKSIIALRTGQQIDSWLILGYFKHLLQLPQRFFDSMRVGEIVSRVNDALRIRVFISDVALNVIVHALTIIFCMTVMFIYNWKLAMVMLMAIPIYGIIYIIINKVNAKWQRKIMENGSALESQLVETVQSICTIRRYASEDHFNLKTENRFIPLMRAIFTSNRNGLILSNSTEWISGLLIIIILWTGSNLVMDHILSPGELLSFYTLSAFFALPVQAIISANRPMQDALVAADRLFEIIDLESEKGKEGRNKVDRFPEGDLVFSNVHFSYAPGNPVFNGLQLRIHQNEMTAVIGISGCGKSTLLSLVQRLYPLNAGNILIGHLDIQDISTDVLRSRIGAVTQQTDLFLGDFISNIALGDPEPNLEMIFEICGRLGLHEFIDHLPLRYQTVIREQGINLSGGQKQRLGIARALYRDPEILILDEATSALDPESERKVLDTLQWFYRRGKMILVIAHRLSTICHCKSVILLKPGGQTIAGTHEKLLEENKEYAFWWGQNNL